MPVLLRRLSRGRRVSSFTLSGGVDSRPWYSKFWTGGIDIWPVITQSPKYLIATWLFFNRLNLLNCRDKAVRFATMVAANNTRYWTGHVVVRWCNKNCYLVLESIPKKCWILSAGGKKYLQLQFSCDIYVQQPFKSRSYLQWGAGAESPLTYSSWNFKRPLEQTEHAIGECLILHNRGFCTKIGTNPCDTLKLSIYKNLKVSDIMLLNMIKLVAFTYCFN